MKIKRFVAKTMREAIRQVREEQGPEAVILSNRRVPGGVEVVAATDYDAALAQQALRHHVPVEPPPSPPDDTPKPGAPRRGSASTASAAAKPTRPAPASAPTSPTSTAAAIASLAAPARPAPGSAPAPAAAAPQQTLPELTQMQRELGTVRKLLEEQLSGMRWDDLKRNNPRRVAVLRALANLGIDADLARALADEVPPDADSVRARYLPQGLLARRIPDGKQDPIFDGGVVALVGPTGVGKTTTIAKLAARFRERNRSRDIALVTLDHYRIGAQEQLYSYGRMLGVPVHNVSPDQELLPVLQELSDRKLVLVDTAGMSQRDRTLQQQIERLARLGSRVRTYVVLAANADNPDAVVRRFAVLKPVGGILTKLDEASSIGPVLSAVIRHSLPLAYVAHGQRVPEDLHLAHTDRLVLCATQLARATPKALDEDTLATRFANPLPQSAHSHV
ncbi:MAG: flagellar biosynthesis protein FlhF [Nevskia sp.]|nr:flagellar biosynthesis protein FlhF [Nevskia sp.]